MQDELAMIVICSISGLLIIAGSISTFRRSRKGSEDARP